MLVIWNHNACYPSYLNRYNNTKPKLPSELLDKLKYLSSVKDQNIHFIIYTSEYNHHVRKLQLYQNVTIIYADRWRMDGTIIKKIYATLNIEYQNLYHIIMIIDYACNLRVIDKILSCYDVITITRKKFTPRKLLNKEHKLDFHRWRDICNMDLSILQNFSYKEEDSVSSSRVTTPEIISTVAIPPSINIPEDNINTVDYSQKHTCTNLLCPPNNTYIMPICINDTSEIIQMYTPLSIVVSDTYPSQLMSVISDNTFMPLYIESIIYVPVIQNIPIFTESCFKLSENIYQNNDIIMQSFP